MSILPSSWRDLVLPRLRRPEPAAPAPPWQAGGSASGLRGGRFEHAGAHHRVQVREHADGSGLVVIDASRLARLAPEQLASFRRWLDDGARDAAAFERATWGEPVLTGTGAPRGVNAWEPGTGVPPVPDVPIVATVEVAAGQEALVAERMRSLHALAIPHVILRPGSEAAGVALLNAVRAAEDLGLVAGVAAPADLLDDGTLLQDLADLGLDHVALTIAGATEASHDAVLGAGEHEKLRLLAARAAALEIPLTGELPLVGANWTHAAEILAEAARLGMLGVTAWAITGAPGAIASQELRQVAATLEHAADGLTLGVTWAAPVRASDVAEAIASGPRTDGDFGVRVRADGSLLPPRGSTRPAGMLGASSWSEVAGSASWQAFRRQAAAPTRCAECPGLALCAVDCPADEEGWA